MSNSDIVDMLLGSGKYPDLTRRKLVTKVSQKTNQLAHNRGGLTAKRDTGLLKSCETVRATALQLQSMQAAIDILDKSANPTNAYLKTGDQLLSDITADPVLVRRLLGKAKKNSSGLKIAPAYQQLIATELTSIVRQNDESITKREIREQLLKLGHNLDSRSLDNHLSKLKKLGAVALSPSPQGIRITARLPID